MLQGFARGLLGSTVIMLTAPAFAAGVQETPAAGTAPGAATAAPPVTSTSASAAQPATPGDGVGDIIVTARRGSENLQDIPVSVQVITGAAVQKLAITSANELSKLAPGLTLGGGGDGSTPKVVLRGVDWRPGSGTPATPIYFNEIPFDPQRTIQDIFDIQQVEVLRGPQGTTRGAPSISGAVTIATRKPDLREFGGYVQGLYGSGDHKNIQGAVNVPIVKDVLAIRAAAYYDDTNSNRVYSLNSDRDPFLHDFVLRTTALFKPTDDIAIQAMYQRRQQKAFFYNQVAGPGSSGSAANGIPANFNGPPLTTKDRRAVDEAGNTRYDNVDFITLNASYEFRGQVLTYNFGRQISRNVNQYDPQDTANFVPGTVFLTSTYPVKPFFETNEIRLSSQRDPDRPFDYNAGWFSKKSGGPVNVDLPVLLPGALGAPTAPPGTVGTVNNRFVLPTSTNVGLSQTFDSFYGSLRFYIGSKTELSGGLSILRDRVPVSLDVTTSAAIIAVTNPLAVAGIPCEPLAAFSPAAAGIVTSPTYGAPTCELPIAAGVGNTSQRFNNKYTKALYNFSLSHKFTDDFLAYATTGSSFRSGLPAIANNGLPNDLFVPSPESAKSYEVGVKSSFGRRLRINVDVFQIDYANQLTAFPGVPYFNSVSGQTSVTSIAFYRNVDARVRGAEAEISAEPIDKLSLGASVSYSKIKSRGGAVPCNDPAGAPLTATNPVNFCDAPKGQTLNSQAPFQATVNGGYSLPLASTEQLDDIEGYFRFNVNVQGKNPNFGNFPVGGEYRKVPSFALVDLFAGVTAARGAIELGAYAKNVFNKKVELTRQIVPNTIYPVYAIADSGYDLVSANLPREIGVTLRYSFGSR